MNFWERLSHKKQPIMILAPMEDVTDSVFRQIVAKTGRPDVFFTEFTSTDALCSPGHMRVMDRLQYTKKERPLVAQIWGTNPENYYQVAKLLVKMGFDGIDINMGCPVKNVVKVGACSALIKNPKLALEIIAATKKGAGKLPVSIKTRIGFNQIETESWVTTLLQANIAALTLHARTAKEKSKVPAQWEEVGKAVEVRNKLGVNTLIIGNGDILSLEEAYDKASQYQADGIMVGRGIFHNIWLFDPNINPEKMLLKDRLNLLENHLKLFKKTWGSTKNYAILKKFYKIYISEFPGATEIRNELMNTKNYPETTNLVRELRTRLSE